MVDPTKSGFYPGFVRREPHGNAFTRLIRTTDAKQIGLLYLTTSFGYFAVGDLMALIMRAELTRPGMQLLSPVQYNHRRRGGRGRHPGHPSTGPACV
jgi:cytochrome c oxidase subunit 1